MSSPTPDLLRTVIEPLVVAEGLDLEAIDVAVVGRRRRIKVVVDADGGVDLDRCAQLSHVISAALDDTDVAGEQAYTLEVSSPGVSRPLTEPKHWRRNVGRLVRVHLREGGETTGRIVAADDDEAVLDTGAGERPVPYRSVAKAKVQVEFRRADDRRGA